MSDERIKKAYDLAVKYGIAERECRWHESGLDADDCFRDLMIYVKGLVARIAELEHDLSNKEIEYTDLWDDMLEMQARIAELETERRWIPVSEGLPELDQDVFAVVDGELDRGHFYQQWDGEVFFSSDEKGAMMVATHWMPLPELPEVTHDR